MDELRDELADLRGEIETVRHQAKQALELAKSSEKRPVQAAPVPAPRPEREASQEVGDYEQAFGLYREGQYQGGIDRFQAFLQNYPSSDYADNALFWIGECHFQLGDYERAVLTFEDVVKRYPDENKVPDALYRQGIALVEIGRRDQQEQTYASAGCEIFERIVRDYPRSDRVPEARRQMEKLCR